MSNDFVSDILSDLNSTRFISLGSFLKDRCFKMMKFCITVLMAISMVGNAALIRLPLDFEVNNYTVIKPWILKYSLSRVMLKKIHSSNQR